MRKIFAVVAITLTALGAVGCGDSSAGPASPTTASPSTIVAPHQLTGDVFVWIGSTAGDTLHAVGDACHPSINWVDGASIEITDGSGRTVGAAPLGDGKVTTYGSIVQGFVCSLRINTSIEDAKFYRVKVAGHDAGSYSAADMAKHSYNLRLSVSTVDESISYAKDT